MPDGSSCRPNEIATDSDRTEIDQGETTWGDSKGSGEGLLSRSCAGALFAAVIASSAGAGRRGPVGLGRRDQLRKINHIVVIYEENHSFDNLYGTWEGVNGLANANAVTRLNSIRPVRRTRACFSSTSI